ncbi:hypothetical protein DH86_00004302, partial [Scytalidium sp. 3C]
MIERYTRGIMSTSTHTFKTVGGDDLLLDLTLPENFNKETGVVVVHFHGGFLVTGEKTSYPPVWLSVACRHRGWAYITANYRLLPEASGLDLLEDAVDALHWASKNVTERVISAGTSGGGYVALATAANPKSPPLLAVFAMH